MTDVLQIVPGRIVAASGLFVTAEFEPEQRPSVGALLIGHGSVVEVIAALSPSEIRAVVRKGPLPKRDAVLSASKQGLGVAAVDALWGSDAEIMLGGAVPLASDTAEAAGVPQTAPWALGHPGVDLVAPLVPGVSLAMTGNDGPALTQLAVQHLAFAASKADAAVLWVSCGLDGKLPEAMRSERTIHLPASGSAGEQALIFDAAEAMARAITAAGHPLMVVLSDPLSALIASVAARDQGPAAFAAVLARFRACLDALSREEAPCRTAVAILPQDPIREGQLGPGSGDLARFAGSIARFEGTDFLFAESSTSAPLTETHSALRGGLLSALDDAGALMDHALIFGEDELDPDQADAKAHQEAVAAWLTEAPSEPLDPNALRTHAQALIDARQP